MQLEHLITLLVSCQDQPGIVATISRFIFEHHGNIVHSDQYATELQYGTFFMRISFVEEGFTLSEAEIMETFQSIAQRFEMSWSLHYTRRRKRACILVSKQDHCLTDLLWRWKSGELAMDLACIISNHQDLAPLAAMYDVPYHYLPIQRESRTATEHQMLAFLKGQVDFLILARYMQVLEPFFVQAFPHQIINIHHSFLPAFTGARPYERAFERGVKIIGATAHYVTDALDEGPIIAQDIIHCNHRDSVPDLVRKGSDVERRVLAEAVRLHIEDRVLVYKNKTLIF